MLIAYGGAYDGLYKLGNGTYIYTFCGLVGFIKILYIFNVKSYTNSPML